MPFNPQLNDPTRKAEIGHLNTWILQVSDELSRIDQQIGGLRAFVNKLFKKQEECCDGDGAAGGGGGGGAGDIEEVVAGAGLTGGGDTGSVTLDVAVTSPLTVAANSVGMVNQGTSTTVLHGNAAGNPAFSAVVEADITLSDNTTNDVSTARHGFVPKAPNDSAKFLDGTGAWTTPAAGAGDIESVTAGDGLTGGGTSGAVTLNVAVTSPLTVAADSVGMVNQGTTTTVLHGNAAGNPSFAAVGLTTDVTGILPVANGGTGLSSGTSGGVLAFTAAGTIVSSGALTANLPVIGGGAGVAPTVGTRSGNTTAYVTTTGAQTSGDCVEIDANGNHIASGAACGSGGGGEVVDIQLFEVADTGTDWTLPTDGQWIEVIACGSGGGGGGGSGAAVSNVRAGGGGGGGGFCWQKVFQAADITSPVTVTVGAGGAGGAGGTAGAGTDGATGNTSSFGTYLIAYGGGGGAGHNAGAAGGGGGGCGAVGASATTTSGVAGGECVLASAANTTYADCRGAGSGNTQAAGNGGRASDCGGGSGSTSSSTGGGGTLAGGKSRLSSGGGGHGGGVNNANPGTAQDGQAGGDAGNMSTSLNGGGGAAGASASACGAGGEGQPGNAAINTWRPGGQGGGGGASKNSTTGCDGGDGGYGGGGGGGGGGGTNTGGAGGDGGPGYVLIVTHF